MQNKPNFPKRKFEDRTSWRKVLDTIHGFIAFPPIVWKFIDHPAFQRLRKIKQISCLEYVFPSAHHSRFEHCIGTGYLAQKYILTLMDSLNKDHPDYYSYEERYNAEFTLTLAGVLHDVGHGPFSHTFDHVVEAQGELEIAHPNGTIKCWKHELASVAIFDFIVADLVREGYEFDEELELSRVRKLISGYSRNGQFRPWYFDLINNEMTGIDVDKLDYFRRDAYYTGCKRIFIEHDLLIRESRIIDNYICFPTKYSDSVNDIFHSRYKLYKTFYHNITSKGIELMICDALEKVAHYFKLKTVCERIFTHTEDYLKFNDTILDRILFRLEFLEQYLSPETKETHEEYRSFKEAADILKQLHLRKIYKLVKYNHIYIKKDTNHKRIKELFTSESICSAMHSWLQKKNRPEAYYKNRFHVAVCTSGFGKLDHGNPLMRVGFFDKEKCKRCPGQKLVRESPDNIEKISMLLTEAFSEISFRVYIRSYDASKESLLPTLLEQAFNNFWQEEKTVIELNQVSAKILDGFDVKTTIISQEFNQELPPLAEEEERIAQIAEEACP